jgi:hypothetical protein
MFKRLEIQRKGRAAVAYRCAVVITEIGGIEVMLGAADSEKLRQAFQVLKPGETLRFSQPALVLEDREAC